jgi:acid stress-induced BolA-like protein IbaG/YrbA
MKKEKIKEILESSFYKSSVEVDGGEGKFNAKIIYDGFKGMNTIERHKKIYSVLDSYIKSGELHAISLKTYTNDEI